MTFSHQILSESTKIAVKEEEGFKKVDYDEEAKKVFQNQEAQDHEEKKQEDDLEKRHLTCVYVHPDTQAKFYIGGLAAAQSLEIL